MLGRRVVPIFCCLTVFVLGFVVGVGRENLLKIPDYFFKMNLAELLNFAVPALTALIVATIVSDKNSKILRRREILDSLLAKLGDVLESIDSEVTKYQETHRQQAQQIKLTSAFGLPYRERPKTGEIISLLKRSGMLVAHLEEVQKEFSVLSASFIGRAKNDVMELRKLLTEEPFGNKAIPEDRWKRSLTLLNSLQMGISRERISLYS